MKEASLTIDVTPELLRTGIPASNGRVRRFARRVFAHSPVAILKTTWGEGWLASLPLAEERLILVPIYALAEALNGDQLHIQVRISSADNADIQFGKARILDGKAVFVNHVLANAEPGFAYRIAQEIPTDRSEQVSPDGRDPLWHRAFEATLHELAAKELGSVRAATPLSRFSSNLGAPLALRPTGRTEDAVPFARILNASGNTKAAAAFDRLVERITSRFFPVGEEYYEAGLLRQAQATLSSFEDGEGERR